MTTEPNDHEAIRQLTARYCRAADTKDRDSWVACFAPDAECEFGGLGEARGHDELHGFFHGVTELWSFMWHTVANHRLEVNDDGTARGACYFDFRAAFGDEAWIGGGEYLDEYRKIAGQWKIFRRRVRFDFLSPMHVGWGATPRVRLPR